MKYFELKVVKVKKEKCKHYQFSRTEYMNSEYYCRCPKCGESILIKDKYKGNWVNGENLDKIKFPCFCSYKSGNHKFYGEIDKNWDDLAYDYVYQISQRTQQATGLSVVFTYMSLEELFKNHKVKVLKGKIIIFEEEE